MGVCRGLGWVGGAVGLYESLYSRVGVGGAVRLYESLYSRVGVGRRAVRL